MAVGEVKVTAKKIKNREKKIEVAKVVILTIFVLLVLTFLVLSIIYKGGKFTVTLDPNFNNESGIVIYDDSNDPRGQRKLTAETIEYMDNISIKWLPKNLDKTDGSHNGENYIAYTFYIKNEGIETVNYWYEIQLLDVIKNVDEAIRIMVIHNGKETVYAKINGDLNEPEKGTETFYDEELAVLKQKKDFKPNDIDKFTIVIWLEGDDPDCVDSIIGGEVKVAMNITEEHKEVVKKISG